MTSQKAHSNNTSTSISTQVRLLIQCSFVPYSVEAEICERRPIQQSRQRVMQVLTRAGQGRHQGEDHVRGNVIYSLSLSGWGLGHRACWRLHMSASLFPGSCSILLGLVSMATAPSRQPASWREAGRQGRQGEKAWAVRGRLKLWGLGELPRKLEGPLELVPSPSLLII